MTTFKDYFDNSVTVPPEPETVSIPNGTVRRFHSTKADNLDSIRKYGITLNQAKGIEGPKAIYSHKTFKDARTYSGDDYSIIEFFHPQDAYDSSPYATHQEVAPENIIGIHERWHEIYRHYKTNKDDYDYAKQTNLDTADDLPDYKRAIQQIDKEGIYN